MSKSADQVFANGVTFSQAGYLARLQEAPDFHMSNLLLHQTGNEFVTTGEEPTFIEEHRAAIVLSDANSMLVDYAAALQQLASPNLVSQATFDQMTKDLSADNSSLSAAMKKSSLTPSSSELNLFSTAGVEAAHRFIEQRRRADLVNAIEANQSALDQFSLWCETGVKLLMDDVYNSYNNQMGVLSAAFQKTKQSGKSDSTQSPLIKQAVELDTTFLSSEEALQALDDAYKAVPKAHQNLAIAVQSPKGALADLQTLNQTVRRLQNLSGGAKATSSAAPSPSPQASPSPSASANSK